VGTFKSRWVDYSQDVHTYIERRFISHQRIQVKLIQVI
jgi:hypothetical protein